MRPSNLALCAALLSGGAAAAAEAVLPALDDPHLASLPRSAEERARIAAVTAPARAFSAPEPFEARPAGAATVPARADAQAFAQPSANMAPDRRMDFNLGDALFQKLWVSSPSSTRASDGLGPLYNARSCLGCHIRDGRGHPPDGAGDDAVSMFLRVSVPADPQAEMPAIAGWIATAPDPVYGAQLQEFGTVGHRGEARLEVTYEEIAVPLSGGETVSLRVPRYRATDLAYGPLGDGAMLSPRVAPQMIGLGLLEAIPAEDILAGADPEDADGDGISGRAAVVWSLEYDAPMLGRFGWKAGEPTVRAQSASAFAGDIGIATPLHPALWGECTEAQAACRDAPHGDDAEGFEIGVEGFDMVSYYSQNLAVPARRDLEDPEVLRGKRVFYETGCTSCHRPKFVTARMPDRPEQSFQLIWPYSDLLLHDMGEGLADHRPEGRATGTEWRTPPLWGIGLTERVSGHTTFLHDGRARSLIEAILWHGGEAQPHRDAVISMAPADRAALIQFLESL
ncbi:c-type cytochrome [Salipiger sp. P9]|uniref:di-heme oxidoreductase family protein n=1 Tax=Salipiger pentaromativorans TaxID=2943193 RepID=UPI0021572639|nr:di-heme oxidoredictase family protein [Salipiger pentaromativorans]MCR8550159.1 c-type cytochrome [Salipiger pentaromativorans]